VGVNYWSNIIQNGYLDLVQIYYREGVYILNNGYHGFKFIMVFRRLYRWQQMQRMDSGNTIWKCKFEKPKS